MLAYVFWHAARPAIAARHYEAAHRAFHAALAQQPVAGLIGVRVFCLATIPWLDPPQAGYEDWHLLSGSAALDTLNAAAVSGRRLVPHDRIAAMAASGTAGLYALRSGVPITPTRAYWMSKPAGMSYLDFDRSMQPLVDAGASLWARRMTLGSTPEFCLHSAAAIVPPHAAQDIPLELVFGHD
ncbi:MAG: hypothetical protein WD793_10325 [Steroidobacteraceae bacterium]